MTETIELQDFGRSVTEQFDDMNRRIDEAQSQVQHLQGAGGLLEPLSNVVGYNQVGFNTVDPTTTVLSAVQVTYVGQAQVLLAGDGITFDAPDNSPYLRISADDLSCYDYVVDSDGTGTHTALFGTAGALEAAIATGGSRTIFVCSTHTETVSTQHALTNLATSGSQRIHVIAGGKDRPRIIVGSGLGSAAMILYNPAANSGSDTYLVFQGMAFDRPSAATAGDFLEGQSGRIFPNLEFIDCLWTGASSQWTDIIDVSTTAGSGHIRDFIMQRCEINVSITSLIHTRSTAASTGRTWIKDCRFTSLANVQLGGLVEIGLEGVIIEGNLFIVMTGPIWTSVASGQPFAFNDNVVLDFTAADSFIDIGTSGTTSPKDATIDGNFIRCSNTSANTRAVTITGGAGTATNISIVGNSLRGPGGANAHIAIAFDIANVDCAVLNSYRDWGTNVGGTTGPTGTGGDHGALIGLLDDDHTIYVLLAGRAGNQTIHGGLNAGESLILRSTAHATRGDISIRDATFITLTANSVIDLYSGGSRALSTTANQQVQIPGTGSSAGLVIGLDVQLYRGAANELHIPDEVFILNGRGFVVGHTAQINFGAIPEFQVLGTTTPDSSMGFARFEDNASGPDVRFLKSRGITIGANIIVQDGDTLGRFRFQGADGGDFNTTAAEVLARVDGTPGLNDIPGVIVFRTRLAAGTLADRMELTNDGSLRLLTGPLFLTEQATANADIAAKGQFWVLMATPNTPQFTDDAGNDRALIWSGGTFHDGFSDFVANEHLLPAAIDHDVLLNFVAGKHLTVGAIDHDLLLNFLSTEHFTEGSITHGSIGGLGVDDHSIYALLAGRSGGQTLIGDTASGGNLLLESTSHATKGAVQVIAGTALEVLQGYIQLEDMATPVTPVAGDMRFFVRITGNRIQLISQGPSGAECIICDLSNVPVPPNTLALNWIE